MQIKLLLEGRQLLEAVIDVFDLMIHHVPEAL